MWKETGIEASITDTFATNNNIQDLIRERQMVDEQITALRSNRAFKEIPVHHDDDSNVREMALYLQVFYSIMVE